MDQRVSHRWSGCRWWAAYKHRMMHAAATPDKTARMKIMPCNLSGSAMKHLFKGIGAFVFACMLSSCGQQPGESDSAVGANVSVSHQALGAPPDSRCAAATFQGHEYWFCGEKRSWSSARTQCQAAGMDLARIDSAAENAFVYANLRSDTWIGAHDQAVEGAWRWADNNAQFWNGGKGGSAVGGLYKNWASAQPDDWFNQDCGALETVFVAGQWTDRYCTEVLDFVCERALGPSDGGVTCDTHGTPWPGFRRCLAHQAQSSAKGPTSADPVLSFATAGDVESSPAIGVDGTIYVGSNDGYVYALNRDASLRWRFQTPGAVRSSPAIGPDGTIFVGSSDGLYAINPNGTQRWKFFVGAPVRSSPAINQSGVLFFGSDNAKFYAVDSAGSKLWSYTTVSVVRSSPAIGPDGTIYFGSDDWSFFAFNPNGTLKWSYVTQGPVTSSPVIAPDGMIVFGSQDGRVYALYPGSGALKWSHSVGDYILSSPAIAADGTVIVGDHTNRIRALSPTNGTLKWAFQTGGDVFSSPAIDGAGRVYVGSNDKKLHVLDTTNGVELWSLTTAGEIVSSPAIADNGAVIFGSNDDKLYVIPPLHLQSDMLDAMVDELSAEQHRLAGGSTPQQRDAARAFVKNVAAQANNVVSMVPVNSALTPETDMRPIITALGRAWAAGTLLRAGAIGRRVDGTVCPDNVLFDSEQLVASPLSAFFEHVPNVQDEPSMMRAVHALGRVQKGIRCLRTPELATLDRAAATELTVLMSALGASSKSMAATAFYDATLPIQLLLFDAMKSINTPFVWKTLNLPKDLRAIVPPNQEALPNWIDRSQWFGADVPFASTMVNFLYCNRPATHYTLGTMGLWLEDVVHAGWLNRAKIANYCEAWGKILDPRVWGAGDCSILETALQAWVCRSKETCTPTNSTNFLPSAIPGTRRSALTRLMIPKEEARTYNCIEPPDQSNYGTVEPTRECLHDPVEETLPRVHPCFFRDTGPVALRPPPENSPLNRCAAIECPEDDPDCVESQPDDDDDDETSQTDTNTEKCLDEDQSPEDCGGKTIDANHAKLEQAVEQTFDPEDRAPDWKQRVENVLNMPRNVQKDPTGQGTPIGLIGSTKYADDERGGPCTSERLSHCRGTTRVDSSKARDLTLLEAGTKRHYRGSKESIRAQCAADDTPGGCRAEAARAQAVLEANTWTHEYIHYLMKIFALAGVFTPSGLERLATFDMDWEESVTTLENKIKALFGASCSEDTDYVSCSLDHEVTGRFGVAIGSPILSCTIDGACEDSCADFGRFGCLAPYSTPSDVDAKLRRGCPQFDSIDRPVPCIEGCFAMGAAPLPSSRVCPFVQCSPGVVEDLTDSIACSCCDSCGDPPTGDGVSCAGNKCPDCCRYCGVSAAVECPGPPELAKQTVPCGACSNTPF